MEKENKSLLERFAALEQELSRRTNDLTQRALQLQKKEEEVKQVHADWSMKNADQKQQTIQHGHPHSMTGY